MSQLSFVYLLFLDNIGHHGEWRLSRGGSIALIVHACARLLSRHGGNPSTGRWNLWLRWMLRNRSMHVAAAARSRRNEVVAGPCSRAVRLRRGGCESQGCRRCVLTRDASALGAAL